MTWTTEDSIAMVRHYLGYEIDEHRAGWFVRKGEDRPWEVLPYFPNDRDETFRCLEAWGRYHPGVRLNIRWSEDMACVWVTESVNGATIVTPTLIEALLRMLLAEALAAKEAD